MVEPTLPGHGLFHDRQPCGWCVERTGGWLWPPCAARRTPVSIEAVDQPTTLVLD
jgi:hypothetical protein